MIYIIAIALISSYLAIVVGTIAKFERNYINLSGTVKILTVFLPLVIFITHLKMAYDVRKISKHKSWDIIKMGTVNYPVALGILIEVILERHAQMVVFGPRRKELSRKSIVFNTDSMSRRRDIFDVYEKTTETLATC